MLRSSIIRVVGFRLVAVCLLAACIGGVGCRPLQSETRKPPFWHKFLPPEDFLWDDRSREIENNLQRENRVSIH